MDGNFVEPATTRLQSQSSSHSADGRDNDAGGFECNICLDLAQDPIVTLCGHLFCWPCLYKWLLAHAHSHECPVCKAIVEKEKLVPLYGRGKNSTDPRSKSVPGIDIPQRPAGQRPETAPPADQTQFNHQDFGFMAGFPPVATARWGNVSVSAGIGGLFPSLFNFHMHGFPDASPYGMSAGFPYGLSNSFHGGHAHGFPQYNTLGQQPNSYLKRLLFIVGALVVFALLWM